jgi:hypothetical protein
MSRKRLTREDQIELDTERLNDALDELIAQLGTTVQGSDVDLQRAALQSKMRLDAIKLLPGLLERKAKLLGLDFVHPAESPGQAASGTLAELERKLALVPAGKAS